MTDHILLCVVRSSLRGAIAVLKEHILSLIFKHNGNMIEFDDSERQENEIWTRVMGYYRPVSEFNIGKTQEHKDRLLFRENMVKDFRD